MKNQDAKKEQHNEYYKIWKAANKDNQDIKDRLCDSARRYYQKKKALKLLEQQQKEDPVQTSQSSE